MKCPICDDSTDEQDGLLVCQGCGAEFGLEYLGCYEKEGSCERTDAGFESDEWSAKYMEKLRSWKSKQ